MYHIIKKAFVILLLLVSVNAPGQLSLFKDITEGENGSGSIYSIKIGDYYYFQANDGIHGFEFWKTDGSQENTTLAFEIVPGANGFQLINMCYHNGLLYIIGVVINDGESFTEIRRLWVSDLTTSGTFELLPGTIFNSEIESFNIADIKPFGEKILFTGSLTPEDAGKTALWESDGTIANTIPLTFMNSVYPPQNNSIGSYEVIDSLIIMNYPWYNIAVSNGTSEGTRLIFPYRGYSSRPLFMKFPIRFKDKIVFFAPEKGPDSNGYFLWSTDGTIEGTKKLDPFPILSPSLNYNPFFGVCGDYIYFLRRKSFIGSDIWRTNGNISGAEKVGEFFDFPHGWFNFKIIEDKIYIAYSDVNRLGGLIEIDGSSGAIREIMSQPKIGSNELSVTNSNGRVMFLFDDGDTGSEPYLLDNTTGRGFLVEDLLPGPLGSAPRNFMPFDDKILFFAGHPTLGYELFQYKINDCEDNINYSIKSGDWSSPAIWACGHIPQVNEKAVIKSGQNVIINNSINPFVKSFETETGAVLEILPTNSVYVDK